MTPNGMDGENQFSGISMSVIQIHVMVLAAAINSGVDIAAMYHIGLKRH